MAHSRTSSDGADLLSSNDEYQTPQQTKMKQNKSKDNHKKSSTGLQVKDVCVGSILDLPPRLHGSKNIYSLEGKTLDEEGYNHPVTVLRVNYESSHNGVDDFTVDVAMITTFQNMPLEKYIHKRVKSPYHRRSIPIISGSTIQYSNPTLKLDRNRFLVKDKQSYVRLYDIWTIPFSSLKLFRSCSNAHSLRLDAKSYKLLMKELEQQPEEYPPRKAIWEHNERRLGGNLERMISSGERVGSSPSQQRLGLRNFELGMTDDQWNEPSGYEILTGVAESSSQYQPSSSQQEPSGGKGRSKVWASTSSTNHHHLLRPQAQDTYGTMVTSGDGDGANGTETPKSIWSKLKAFVLNIVKLPDGGDRERGDCSNQEDLPFPVVQSSMASRQWRRRMQMLAVLCVLGFVSGVGYTVRFWGLN